MVFLIGEISKIFKIYLLFPLAFFPPEG